MYGTESNICVHTDVFRSYLPWLLPVLGWSKKNLRSEKLGRRQPFIQKTCLCHEWDLRLLSSNRTQSERQQYLFSLSQTVIRFCSILLNIVQLEVLTLTHNIWKSSLKSQEDIYWSGLTNTLHNQNVIICKSFSKVLAFLWVTYHTLRLPPLPWGETPVHIKIVRAT
jgi:hypothetical protein